MDSLPGAVFLPLSAEGLRRITPRKVSIDRLPRWKVMWQEPLARAIARASAARTEQVENGIYHFSNVCFAGATTRFFRRNQRL